MHIYSTISFAKFLRKKRKEMKMSQREFGEKIGIHRTYVGAIERGEKNITLETILRILSDLNLNFIIKENTPNI
jgi:transcriptional regulator with XRE-family HTH domain